MEIKSLKMLVSFNLKWNMNVVDLYLYTFGVTSESLQNLLHPVYVYGI